LQQEKLLEIQVLVYSTLAILLKYSPQNGFILKHFDGWIFLLICRNSAIKFQRISALAGGFIQIYRRMPVDDAEISLILQHAWTIEG
jgi:hypothetical protein